VRPKPGAFLENEYSLDEKGSLQEDGDSQYYFSDAVNGKIRFAFIADWKSSGELSCSIRTSKPKTRVR
jgi:hypothetical protein